MKVFSVNVNLALLSVEVAWNGSSPPREQMAPQWHQREWRRKENKKAKEIWVENWRFEERQKPLAKRAWCLRPRHGKAGGQCCSTALGLGLHRSSFQVLPHSPGTPWAAPSTSQPWSSCAPAVPQLCPSPALARAVPHTGVTQGCSPSQDTTAHPAKAPSPQSSAQELGLDQLANVSGYILKSGTAWFPLPLSSVLILQRRVLPEGAAPRSEQNFNYFTGFMKKLQVKMLGLSMNCIPSFYFEKMFKFSPPPNWLGW